MKVAIGTDHNGPALKEEIINKLSDIWGEPRENVQSQIFENLRRLLSVVN